MTAGAGAHVPLPMFPLGSVLVPGMPLPLHVFEDRYRRLVDDCLRTDRRFGVVLIARGREVGGGDERLSFGTLARIVDTAPTPEGTLAVVAVGESRIHVRTWLPDDPYPVALIESADDERFPLSALDRLAAAEGLVRRCLGLAGELGDPAVPADIALDGDPHLAAWQLIGIAPIAAVDRQVLLELDDPVARLDALVSFAEEMAEVLAYRLGRRS